MEFIFLGANIDAVNKAQSLGIKGTNAVKYKNSRNKTEAYYDS